MPEKFVVVLSGFPTVKAGAAWKTGLIRKAKCPLEDFLILPSGELGLGTAPFSLAFIADTAAQARAASR